MTRVIKFRGKSKTGVWHFGSLYINEKGETFIDKTNWTREPVIPETVGQFTGLHDRDGVEIYENDYVYCENTGLTHLVEYKELEGESGQLIIGYGFETAFKGKIKVIGNK